MKKVSLLFVLILTANVCYAQNEGNIPEEERMSYSEIILKKTSKAGEKIAKFFSGAGEKTAEIIVQKKVVDNPYLPNDTLDAIKNPLAEKIE